MDKSIKKSIKLYLDGKQIDGSVKSIKSEIRKLTGEMNKLTIGTKEYEEKAAEISKLNSILKAHRNELNKTNKEFLSLKEKIGGFLSNMKNSSIALMAMNGGISSLFSSTSSLVGVFSKLVDAGKWWFNYNVEIEEAQRLTREFLGITGSELRHVQSQLSAVAKSMGKDYKEVLETVDMLMGHFGITADEAITAIKDGIQAGGDLNGTLLQQLQQFGPAARDAGPPSSTLSHNCYYFLRKNLKSERFVVSLPMVCKCSANDFKECPTGRTIGRRAKRKLNLSNLFKSNKFDKIITK